MRAFVLVWPCLLLSSVLVAHAAAQDAPTQLVITTDPAGANVFVDGRLAGAAPVTLTELLPGEHLVTARAEDGRHVERRVAVDAGRSSVVELAFDPLPAAPVPAPPPAVVEPRAPAAPPPTHADTVTTDPVDRTPVAASLGVLPSAVPGWNGRTDDPRVGIAVGGGITAAVGIITMLIGLAIGIDTDRNLPGFVTFVTGLGLTVVGAMVALIAAMGVPIRGPSTESGVRLGAVDLLPLLSVSSSGTTAGVVLRW